MLPVSPDRFRPPAAPVCRRRVYSPAGRGQGRTECRATASSEQDRIRACPPGSRGIACVLPVPEVVMPLPASASSVLAAPTLAMLVLLAACAFPAGGSTRAPAAEEGS